MQLLRKLLSRKLLSMESASVALKGISSSKLSFGLRNVPVLLTLSSVHYLLRCYPSCLPSILEFSLTLRFSIDHDASDDSKPLIVKSEESSDTETGDLKEAKRAQSTNATTEFRATKIAKAANNKKVLAADSPLGRLDPKSEYEMEETGI